MPIPKRRNLINPLLQTMKELGSSATISELNEAVTKRLHLTDEEIAKPHGVSNMTELQYQLAWTRTYLKAYGLLDNSERGIWVLTAKGKEVDSVKPTEIEATRDGVPPIDLLDGEQLLDKLKELRLGVTVKMIEQVSVLPEFFKDI